MLLTGKPPFDESRQSGRLRANATQAPPSIRERLQQIPSAMGKVIDACLAKDSSGRPASARELYAAIRDLPASLTETGVFRAITDP